MLHVEIAARSETGERTHNEDDLRYGNTGPLWHAVLSDGAGGHRGGAIASDLVVRLTALGMQSAPQATPDTLTRIICDAHAALGEQQHGRRGHERMHATVVALWIDTRREQAVWTHVGDSRLYLLRHGQVQRVTNDDSVVQRMVHAGYLSRAEARSHPRKNQLLSAVGSAETIEPNTVEHVVPIDDGDAFLLCTDGWWDHFEPRDIEIAFVAARSPQHWLDLMAEQVRRAGVTNQDNYSAVAVWIGDPAETTCVGEYL